MTEKKTLNNQKHPSSFRDSSGFIFLKDGILYRQVNNIYREHYDALMASGLYDFLTENKLLVPHEEADISIKLSADAYKILRPQKIPFISYPYEWSFSQLKQAALATLKIQQEALARGMTLKDCSAYNIQFYQGRPILIDTLSFEKYQADKPWIGYRQFCQHFLAPLALMSYTDIRLQQLLKIYIDGIPLDFASKLLPKRSYARFALLSHIHLHAKSQKRYAGEHAPKSKIQGGMNKFRLNALIDNLASAIKSLQWQKKDTEWGEYYTFTNYSADSFQYKKKIVAEFLRVVKPNSVWDLGANTGVFSRLASEQKIFTVAFDMDEAAVEKNALACLKNNEQYLFPLLLDLTNPSPSIGWAHQERQSVKERGPADLILALALIHHLAISNNVPFSFIADFFASIGNYAVIEFVPREDSQVKKLLATREDIFSFYTQENFEESFSRFFNIKKQELVPGTKRTLYLMEKR